MGFWIIRDHYMFGKRTLWKNPSRQESPVAIILMVQDFGEY